MDVSEALFSTPDGRYGFSDASGSAPDARAYFLLLRQKKVAKEKATPGYAVGCADFPALLDGPGGRLNSPLRGSDNASRLPPARLRCSALHMGTRKSVAARPVSRNMGCCGRPSQKAKNTESRLSPDGFPGTLGGAEQRRSAGGFRRALSEGPSPELRSRPALRVAQGIGHSPAPTQGWPFLWLLSFGHTKESTPADKAEQSASESTPARQTRNTTPTKPAAPETNP